MLVPNIQEKQQTFEVLCLVYTGRGNTAKRILASGIFFIYFAGVIHVNSGRKLRKER